MCLKNTYSSITVIVILLITYSNETYKQRFYVYIIKPVIEKNIFLKFREDRHISHYRLAIDIFNNNKLFGVGFKNFRHESFHRQVNLGENIAVTTHPHQIHFEFLSELGIVGYLIIISFLIYTIFDGYKIYKFKSSKNSLAATFFILATLLPLLPSGSFFYYLWRHYFLINFSFILRNNLKL